MIRWPIPALIYNDWGTIHARVVPGKPGAVSVDNISDNQKLKEMKIARLISAAQPIYSNTPTGRLSRLTTLKRDISMQENGGGAPVPMTGQCHMFAGCNQAYALYPHGDTYQQCVARRNASPSPHSWSSPLGCVDIP